MRFKTIHLTWEPILNIDFYRIYMYNNLGTIGSGRTQGEIIEVDSTQTSLSMLVRDRREYGFYIVSVKDGIESFNSLFSNKEYINIHVNYTNFSEYEEGINAYDFQPSYLTAGTSRLVKNINGQNVIEFTRSNEANNPYLLRWSKMNDFSPDSGPSKITFQFKLMGYPASIYAKFRQSFGGAGTTTRNGYICGYETTSSTNARVVVARYINGTRTYLDATNISHLNLNQWYTLEATATGSSFSVNIGGTTANASDLTHSEGNSGIYTLSGQPFQINSISYAG